MDKIKEVVDARALMTEAMEWSVMKWLTEKKRVRKTADLANATLDRVEAELQTTWDPALKAAFDGKNGGATPAEVQRVAKQLRDAHDAALKGRMEAEDTFEKAEKRMSASLAREGCHKAIAGWDLHEEAIRKSELAGSKR